jgi:hypothetical protein
MESENTTPHDVAEELRFFADLQGKGTVNVDLSPQYLDEIADLIDELATDSITIHLGEHEDPLTINGEYATQIIELAVTMFVNSALKKQVDEMLNRR